jgi:signal peptidase I
MEKSAKKRRSIFALLLSFLTPGLGQLYNGQIRRAGFLYVSGVMLAAIFFSGFYSKFYFLILFLALGICYILFAMADAVYQAIKIKAISLKPYNRWFLYILVVCTHFFLIGFSTYINLFPIKLYRIPSPSMAPNLLPGDYFFIDKKYYRDKQPMRGDIVVFQLPIDPSKDYIKRVVGLPGETVEMASRKVSIDKQVLNEPYLKRSGLNSNSIGLNSKIAFGPVVVPENSLFLLGDNRIGSNDSRYFGPVNFSALRGKALFIVWARNKNRIGYKIN